MCNEALALEIRGRIHELKSEQVRLRPFIASDQELFDQLEKAISELNWVLTKMQSEGE
ncbi:MAG: hypothetical protein GX956_10065 [Firmicutes bacterium]|nr:hypothetical protein [Bacillota bacterium]